MSDANDFDWSQFLSIAQSLCRLPLTGPAPQLEAFQRVAVSRAYYAAFAVARNYLRDIELGIASPDPFDSVGLSPSDNVHRAVARSFLRSTSASRVGIGTELARLRVARNQCDYDNQVAGLSALTEDSLRRAAELLAEIDRL